MSTLKATPGPWIAIRNPMRDDSYFVCKDVPPKPYPGGGGAFPGEPPRMQLPPAICGSGMPASDAFLIAAAPDLYAALEALAEIQTAKRAHSVLHARAMTQMPDADWAELSRLQALIAEVPVRWANALTALAKARGEQP